MQAGSGNGAEAEPITAINITPLVDVSLVLVIIFMVTMPFLAERSLKIKASTERVTQVSSITEPVLVEISANGVSIEGRDVPISELAQIMKRRGNYSVAVAANRDISHGRVVEVLDLIAQAGARELNILQPQETAHAN